MMEGLTRIAAEIFWALVEGAGVFLLGKLGSWTAWLISLGRWDVDDESWTALIIGWTLFLACIISVVYWRWHA